MRSAVQSCVPLQESTADRCVFFVYRHQASPKGLDIDIYGAESLLSKLQKWQWTDRERSDRWADGAQPKHHRDSPKIFLSVFPDSPEILRYRSIFVSLWEVPVSAGKLFIC